MSYEFTVYTKPHCGPCMNAKRLLTELGLPFKEVPMQEMDDQAIKDLFARSGLRTFPQIFFGDKVVGGFSDLLEIEELTGVREHFGIK